MRLLQRHSHIQVKLHFWWGPIHRGSLVRSKQRKASPTGFFSPSLLHLFLLTLFNLFLYSSSSPSWIPRHWAVWTRTMRTAQRSLSRCSTATPSRRWRRRSWTRCTRICPTHCDHGLQTWILVRPRGAQSQRRRNSFIILFPVHFLAENVAHCIVWIMTEKEKKNVRGVIKREFATPPHTCLQT